MTYSDTHLTLLDHVELSMSHQGLVPIELPNLQYHLVESKLFQMGQQSLPYSEQQREDNAQSILLTERER